MQNKTNKTMEQTLRDLMEEIENTTNAIIHYNYVKKEEIAEMKNEAYVY